MIIDNAERKRRRALVEQFLNEHDFENAVLLDSPSFDGSIVGVTEGGQVVYDYSKMVMEFAEDNDCSELDAMEFIDYNTMRALPYMGEHRPIVMAYSIDEMLSDCSEYDGQGEGDSDKENEDD